MSTLPRHAVERAALVSKQIGAAEASRAERRSRGTTTVVRSRQIVLQEQDLDCDLIVSRRHGECMLEALIPGGVSKHALAESQCAVRVAV